MTLILIRGDQGGAPLQPREFVLSFCERMGGDSAPRRIAQVVHEDGCEYPLVCLSSAIGHGVPAVPRIDKDACRARGWTGDLLRELVWNHRRIIGASKDGVVLIVAGRDKLIRFVVDNMSPPPPEETTDHWFRNTGSMMRVFATMPTDSDSASGTKIHDPLSLDRVGRM